MSAKPWLIGEQNPYGGPSHRALAPLPVESAGGRLCLRILGMTLKDYLRSFERRNLIGPTEKRWSAPAARLGAHGVLAESGAAPLVLLGERVASAFGVPFEPFTTRLLPLGGGREVTIVVLPHPSGRCRAWNERSAVDSARAALLTVAPQLRELVGVVDGPQ